MKLQWDGNNYVECWYAVRYIDFEKDQCLPCVFMEGLQKWNSVSVLGLALRGFQ